MEGFPILGYTAALVTQVHEGRAILYSVHIAADGANGDCQVYDGEGTGGDLIAHLEALSGTSFERSFARGIVINKGIHLVANAVTTKCTVEYRDID